MLDEGLQLMSALVGTDLGEGDVAPLVAASRGGGGELGFFVGRGLETATLADAFSRSLTEGAAAVIFGEAGIGKTTLVRRFVDDQVGHGVRAGWGAGTTDPRVPLAAWVEVVEGLLCADPSALDGLERSDRQAIDSLLWREPAESTPGPRPTSEGGRERLFDAVVHLLRAWAEAGPVIVVIDDLHMAPPSTRHLTRVVAAAGLPILLIATIRTADRDVAAAAFEPAIPEPGAVAAVQPDVVGLSGLAAEDIEGYLRYAGTGPPPAGTVSWVWKQTGGNPLLFRETARLLLNHRLIAGGGSFHLPSALETASDALLLLRLQDLATDTVTALRAAAVLGTSFAVEDLAHLVVRPERHLDEAVAAGLVTPTSAPGTFEFSHQLLHDAIYRMLPEGERLELHDAAAAALEEGRSDGTPVGSGPARTSVSDGVLQLARHHLAAASLDPSRAVTTLHSAAEVLLASFAYEDAALRLEQAAQIVVDHGLSPVLACQLDIARGDALRQAGDPAATDLLFDAADRAEQLEAGNLLAGAARALPPRPDFCHRDRRPARRRGGRPGSHRGHRSRPTRRAGRRGQPLALHGRRTRTLLGTLRTGRKASPGTG